VGTKSKGGEKKNASFERPMGPCCQLIPAGGKKKKTSGKGDRGGLGLFFSGPLLCYEKSKRNFVLRRGASEGPRPIPADQGDSAVKLKVRPEEGKKLCGRESVGLQWESPRWTSWKWGRGKTESNKKKGAVKS